MCYRGGTEIRKAQLRNCHDDFSKIESCPDVVLLSEWDQEGNSDFQPLQPLITRLIDLGCKYFVCAGKDSERLHDFIDDMILDISLSGDQENGADIMTTWHDDDTNDDVAHFFLHSTNVSNSLLVAFLDVNRVEDCSLRKAILNLL